MGQDSDATGEAAPRREHVIEHVIVLMLENRSFDHLLGFVKLEGGNEPGYDDNGNRLSCPEDPARDSPVFNCVEGNRYASPLDPGHSHAAVMQQLGAIKGRPPDNRGFISSYLGKGRGASAELRDRLSFRLKLVAGATVAVAIVQAFWPLAAGGWVILVIAFAVVGGLLIWNGTSISGHLPRTFLKAIYHKSAARFWLVAISAPLVMAALIAGSFVDWYWARVLTAVLLAVGGTLVFSLGNELGRHDTVVNSGDVLERAVMSSFDPDAIKPLARLAQRFATCTRWFSPVPGETWPNRNFVHAGTSDGAVDIEYRLFKDRTIFDLLGENYDAPDTDPKRDPWRVYFKGVPQVLAYPALWKHIDTDDASRGRFRSLERLMADIDTPDLPAYSFVEPFHGTTIKDSLFDAPRGTTCSQHAGNNRIPVDEYDGDGHEKAGRDFLAGMHLVARIYQGLKEKPDLFAKTVFVVTYDEHGGFFDHRPPPTGRVAPRSPGAWKQVCNWLLTHVYGTRAKAFDFTMYGPRVPTIIISPRVGAHIVPDTFDHTSIPRTIRKIFGITQALSEREAAANTFDHVITETVRATEDLPDLREWLDAYGSPAPAPVQPVDDRLSRSLDFLGLTRAYFVAQFEGEPAPNRHSEPKRTDKALKKAQRAARRASLKALGRAEAGNQQPRALLDRKVARAVSDLESSAS